MCSSDLDDSSAGGSTAPVKEVRVNLEALTAILQEHMDAKAALLSDIPETAMDCGLFAVGTADVRAVLVAKHTAVVGKLLAGHAINCTTTASAINLKFGTIERNLQARPRNVEETSKLEEYVAGVPNLIEPLEYKIEQLVAYNELLDKFAYRTSAEDVSAKWTCISWPPKTLAAAELAKQHAAMSRERFFEEKIGRASCRERV